MLVVRLVQFNILNEIVPLDKMFFAAGHQLQWSLLHAATACQSKQSVALVIHAIYIQRKFIRDGRADFTMKYSAQSLRRIAAGNTSVSHFTLNRESVI